MTTPRKPLLMITALLAFGVATAAPPEKVTVGQSIDAVGQTLTTSQGTWELTNHQSSAGYGVTLNGKPVGFAAKLVVGRDGYPRATHKNGKVYKWTGSTFKLEQ